MIRQERDRLDALGMGKETRRPRPMARPCRACVRRQRRDTADRSLGHVACDGGHPVDRPLADAVGQRVHQIGDIGCRDLYEVTRHLPALQRLGRGRRQRHEFDAETRIDLLDLVAQETGQAPGIAHGLRRADADGLDACVDAMAKQIETARAEPFCLERGTELRGELADVAGDRLGSTDGFREGAPHLDQVERPDRLDRLGHIAERLVETAREFGAKAQRQHRAVGPAGAR